MDAFTTVRWVTRSAAILEELTINVRPVAPRPPYIRINQIPPGTSDRVLFKALPQLVEKIGQVGLRGTGAVCGNSIVGTLLPLLFQGTHDSVGTLITFVTRISPWSRRRRYTKIQRVLVVPYISRLSDVFVGGRRIVQRRYVRQRMVWQRTPLKELNRCNVPRTLSLF